MTHEPRVQGVSCGLGNVGRANYRSAHNWAARRPSRGEVPSPMRISIVMLLAMPVPAWADDPGALFDALRLDEVIAIMREEGIEYGEELRADLFPSRPAAGWSAEVEDIYAAERMEVSVREAFEDNLGDAALAPVVEFFASGQGVEIVSLEIDARRAMLDEAVAEAAEVRAIDLRAGNDPLIGRIEALIEAGGLIDENVVGAMNANYAFYDGLLRGGAFPGQPDEGELIADVWAQEPQIRDETTDWMYGYLSLAYAPLDRDALDAYIALFRSPEGQAVNAAIFEVFNDMYVDVSRRLGLAAAAMMAGEDI